MLTTPTWAFFRSSSVSPIPYSMACAAGCVGACVIVLLYLFSSICRLLLPPTLGRNKKTSSLTPSGRRDFIRLQNSQYNREAPNQQFPVTRYSTPCFFGSNPLLYWKSIDRNSGVQRNPGMRIADFHTTGPGSGYFCLAFELFFEHTGFIGLLQHFTEGVCPGFAEALTVQRVRADHFCGGTAIEYAFCLSQFFDGE